MKEIIAKAEKSFRKASLRDHRMKAVNLVKVNTLSMQWPVPNLVQLYYASVVKSRFKNMSCVIPFYIHFEHFILHILTLQ